MRPQILLYLFLSTACAVHRPQTPVGAPLEVAPDLVTGFDPLEEEALWHAGDHALFHVTSVDGDEVTERWMRVEVLEPRGTNGSDGSLHSQGAARSYDFTANGQPRTIHVPLLDVAIDVYGDDGSLLAADRAEVPETFLTRGFAPMARATLSGWPKPGATDSASPEDVDGILSWLALTTYLELIQASAPLSSLFWDVVDRPPFWSLLGGVRLSITDPGTPTRSRQVELAPPIGSLPAWSLPLALDLNDGRAVDIELVVVEARPPFLISGGMIELVAKHPKKPREVRIELVSSRRGSGTGFARPYGE